jgi:hypothetical protein
VFRWQGRLFTCVSVALAHLWEEKFTGWIKGIDIDTQVYRLLGADPLPDLLDDTISTNLVNFPGLDDLEATVTVVLVVGGSRQRRTDAGVDVGVVG